MTFMPSSGPKHVILVNRFFFPDQSPTSDLLSDLAFSLSERGIRVTAITSRLRYDDRAAMLPPHEMVGNVEIRRVWSFRTNADTLLGRALEYLSFYLSASVSLWQATNRGDVIVAKTDPPLLSLIAAPVARLRRARLINWLQDIFPEVAERLGVAGGGGRTVFRLLRPLRNRSLRSADMNIVPGNWMAATLRQEGIDADRVKVIPNWCDGDLIKPTPSANGALRAQWELNDLVVVAYAGNLGRAHEFDTILETMSLHQDRCKSAPPNDLLHRIVFLFVGGGAQRKRLGDEIAARKLNNVRLRPYQPRERLSALLGIADIHLVSLMPDLEGLIVPSKFYGIAAAARPAIFIGSRQGEIAQLVDEAQCGITIEPGDNAGLLACILELARDPERRATMGARARRAFDAQWEKRHGMACWREIIGSAFDEAVARPKSS